MSLPASLGCALVLLFAAASFADHEPVIVDSTGNPLVSFRFVFRTGSANDPVGKEGLNALTATMISEGGTRELSLVQVIERLYPMAAVSAFRPSLPTGSLAEPVWNTKRKLTRGFPVLSTMTGS